MNKALPACLVILSLGGCALPPDTSNYPPFEPVAESIIIEQIECIQLAVKKYDDTISPASDVARAAAHDCRYLEGEAANRLAATRAGLSFRRGFIASMHDSATENALKFVLEDRAKNR